jgi:3-deoxy-D-arabino-heptulosonate 7-phosphate (DAHP) synthase
MEIIEQTSERLTIQDSSLNLGMSKLLFSIFSIWGIGDVIYSVIKPSFLNAITIIHTEVMAISQIEAIAFQADMLQVGSRNMQNIAPLAKGAIAHGADGLL